jgi:hypothetical protein
MMLARIISLATFAAVAGTLLVSSTAEAGSRGRLCFLGFICQNHDDVYFEEDERPLTYSEPDDGYYEPGYEGEEPVYITPKKKKKTAKAAPAKLAVKKSVVSSKKKAVKTQSVASVEKKAVTERKTANAATSISCDKAGQIVSGYGFASVKPATCTGQVFAFNATRSGKAYVIKLSSATGELTEVQKVQ